MSSVLLCILVVMASSAAGYFAHSRDPLWALNFGVLQWLGLRLFCGWSTRDYPAGSTPGRWWSSTAPPRGVPVRWSLWCWVVPLTGWRTNMWLFSRRLHVVSLRWPETPAGEAL